MPRTLPAPVDGDRVAPRRGDAERREREQPPLRARGRRGRRLGPFGHERRRGRHLHLDSRGIRPGDLPGDADTGDQRRGRRRRRPSPGAEPSVPPSSAPPSVPPVAVLSTVVRLLRLLLRPVRDHLRHQRQRRQHGPDPQQRHHRDRDGLERGRREQRTQRHRAVEPLRRPRAGGDHVERRASRAADHARVQRPDLPGDADGLVRVEVDVVGVQVDREVGVPDRVEPHPDALLPGVGQHHLDGPPPHGPGVRRLDAEHQVADPVDPQHDLGQGRRGRGRPGCCGTRRRRRTGSPPARHRRAAGAAARP